MKTSIKITVSAVLVAIGIVIPMFMPKIQIEPASFTLASHVAVFLGMMISPSIGIAVAVGTTAGFFVSTTPVIALRAASHLVFVLVGSTYLKAHPKTFDSTFKIHLFSLLIGILHAFCEVTVVTVFYMVGSMGSSFYESGFVKSVLLLVGVGSVVHSMIDFEISLLIYRGLRKQFAVSL